MAKDETRSHGAPEAEADTFAREDLEETRGILDKDADPEWATPQKTSAWVRELRADDDAATQRKIGQPDRP